MLKSINLSTSSICGGNCIFCPENRGKRIQQKFMTFELAKKIIDEISSDEFKKKHRVRNIGVAENGDAFLNKELINILRYIKLKLPQVKVIAATNFQNFTEDKAQIILSEQLIDSFLCNIDASSERNFFAAKGLKLQTVKKNLIDFIKIREKLQNKSSLSIMAVTLNTYINAVHNCLGFYPTKLKDYELRGVEDDFHLIKEQWKNILDPKKDRISKMKTVFLWAEREKASGQELDYKEYQCPNLQRVKEEAFITPDGTWYACCYDSNTELVLGNVAVDNIDTIFSSQQRKNLIEKLEKREFQKIGGPCKTVNCCQWVCIDGSVEKPTFFGNIFSKYPYLYIVLKILKDKVIPRKI